MNIKDYLPETEILAQLAEECAELSQAALKLRRVLDKTNPTPVTEQVAKAQMIEEISDVVCCLSELDELDMSADADIIERKRARWLSRLKQGAVD